MSIRLHNLTVSYQRHPIVHHVSGDFAPSASTAIVGPNGSGKSTLLKAIMGVIPTDRGCVDLSAAPQIAYLPQRSEIDMSMPISVGELVSSGLWLKLGSFGGIDTAGQRVVLQALEQVGLADLIKRPIAVLSSGQFQRVLFARLLVQDAPVIILDEPFNAIDSKTTAVLLQLIEQWQSQNRTIIAVLHDFDQVKSHFSHTLLLAHELVAWGETRSTLTAENLQKANHLCSHWHEQSEWCHEDERV
jgi:zinc/manganese transport system ATP-binding protein